MIICKKANIVILKRRNNKKKIQYCKNKKGGN